MCARHQSRPHATSTYDPVKYILVLRHPSKPEFARISQDSHCLLGSMIGRLFINWCCVHFGLFPYPKVPCLRACPPWQQQTAPTNPDVLNSTAPARLSLLLLIYLSHLSFPTVQDIKTLFPGTNSRPSLSHSSFKLRWTRTKGEGMGPGVEAVPQTDCIRA